MALVDAHITAQQRLRAIIASAVTNAWNGLPGYNRENVDQFLSTALPVVLAGQTHSVVLTEAYLARALGRQPLGVVPGDLIGAAVRNGTPPETVYTRPFIQLWAALGNGTRWEDAVHGALSRATSTAETDVQLSSRAAFQAVQNADHGIRGYRRTPDAGACPYCLTLAGAFVKSADAMPLHPHCGCSLTPVVGTDAAVTPTPSNVAVHEHGELGAVLGSPEDHFTGPHGF